MKYIIILSSEPNLGEVDPELVEAHESFLDFLNSQGKLFASGPFINRPGGMIILNCDSMAEAQAIAQEFPLIRNKLRQYEILEWEQQI
jgi:uncharacterized protein YciI